MDINFPGTPPLDWYYVIIHTRKKDFKKKLIYFWAFFVDLMGIPLSPRADEFCRVDIFERNLQKRNNFLEKIFEGGGLSEKPSKSASETL